MQTTPLSALCAETIRTYLPPACKDTFRILTRTCVTSTNTLLKEMAVKGEAAGVPVVLLADAQTAGRGRLGRTFFSPGETGLYMSVLVYPDLSPEKALYLTTSAAVACAEALEAVSGRDVKIKWVNDIYMEDRKVCGILTEAGMDAAGKRLSYAVIGMGINLLPPKTDFPAEIAATAASVFSDGGGACDRNRLAAEILSRLSVYLASPGEASYLEAYRSRSLLDGRTVEVRRGDMVRTAVVCGIDAHAGLRVRYPDGTEETLVSGEVVPVSVHLQDHA